MQSIGRAYGKIMFIGKLMDYFGILGCLMIGLKHMDT
jgi:hypothetical protein